MGDEKENDAIKLLKEIDNYYDKLIGEDTLPHEIIRSISLNLNFGSNLIRLNLSR